MLRCQTNTPKMEAEVMAAASDSPEVGKLHKNLDTAFEHGQWWVSCVDCGASWSVNDCQKEGVDYFGFEEVSHGDDSCYETGDEDGCIAGMRCPKCGNHESFKIEIHTVMEFDKEGETMFSDDSPREWDDDSYCECPECHFHGTVATFLGHPPAQKPEPKPVQPNDILAFVNLIANMTADGDPIDSDGAFLPDGTEDDIHFEMQPEDAILTMGELIATARKLQDKERPNLVLLSDRELNQSLAAFRHWQHGLPYVAEDPQYSEYIEDGNTFMDTDEMDALCLRFNLGPIPDEDDKKFAHMKRVADGYFCERHQKHSPGLQPYCRDCDRGE